MTVPVGWLVLFACVGIAGAVIAWWLSGERGREEGYAAGYWDGQQAERAATDGRRALTLVPSGPFDQDRGGA